MGLFDQLKGVLNEIDTLSPGMLSNTLGNTSLGNLQGLLEELQAGGLHEQVKSWLGDGPNMRVTPEQIQAALGNRHVQQIAEQFGLPVDSVLNLLAEHLPATVDAASPNGTLAR